MSGRNRLYERLQKSFGPCLFISHASYYNDVARAVGQYIQHTIGIDIYLALNDHELALAVEQDDHKAIVSHIEDGIRQSTHLLTLIGEHTKHSWWVPFELGTARATNKQIGTLILSEVEYVPSFLRIATLIIDDYECLGAPHLSEIPY